MKDPLPPPQRPVLEDTEHVWLSVVSAGFVLMIAGALFSPSAPPATYGAIVAALGVLWQAVETFTRSGAPPVRG